MGSGTSEGQESAKVDAIPRNYPEPLLENSQINIGHISVYKLNVEENSNNKTILHSISKLENEYLMFNKLNPNSKRIPLYAKGMNDEKIYYVVKSNPHLENYMENKRRERYGGERPEPKKYEVTKNEEIF